jgi:hypothetical protein
MEFNFIDQMNYYESILENIFTNKTTPEPQKMIVADCKKRKIIKNLILDSMLCHDIEYLYNMGTEINKTPETKKNYIKNALTQYNKLIKYINHITDNITKTQLTTVIYPKETDTTPPPEIPLNSKLNRHIVTSIKILKEQIEQTKEKINYYKDYIANFIEPNIMENASNKFALLPIKTDTFDLITGVEITETNISQTDNEIRRMEKRIKTLAKIRDEYVKFDDAIFEIIKQKAFLKSYHIKYRLYLKTIKLDINKIKVLPHDIINNIIEYVGNEHLTNIQNHCICKKYFPGGPEDMRTFLKSWKKKHLLQYEKQVYLRYILHFHNVPYSFTRPRRLQTITKDRIIENITRNSKIFTFHEFHRDVYFLTKILNEKKPCKTKTK